MKQSIKKYVPWIALGVVVSGFFLTFILSKRVTDEQIKAYESKTEEAETYLEARQYSVAISTYFNAVEIIPKRVNAYEGIINILLLKNRPEDAVEVIEKSARSLNYQDKSVLYKLVGDYYYQNRDYSKAHDMYDRGFLLKVKNSGLDLMNGKVYLQLGDVREAKKYLQKNAFTEEEQIETNLLLSYIHAIKDKDQASKYLKLQQPVNEYISYYDEFSDILKSLDGDEKYNATKLARVYINSGYPYLAILALEPLKEEIGEYLEGAYFLGRAYFEYGKYKEAIEMLNIASGLGEINTDILWTKARVYYLMDDLENTVKEYDNALGTMQEEIVLPLVKEYFEILLDNNRKLKAEEVVRSLIYKDLDNPFLNFLALQIYYELNDTTKQDYYMEVLEDLNLEDGLLTEYLEYKAKVLLERKDLEKLSSTVELLLGKDKYNPVSHLLYAKYNIAKGDLELAKQSLERAIEYDLGDELSGEAYKVLSSLR